jgi:hypothetical protein
MMKRLGLTILCCFLLSGCIFDPAFDTSSWDAYQRSLAAIKENLSDDDSRRLEAAMKYLVIETTPTLEINGQMLSNVAGGGSLANPYIILTQIGPWINGRSAPTVIHELRVRLDAEISQAEAELRNVEGGSLEVRSPNYYWRRTGRSDQQPVIEFGVFNAGKLPVSRIYFRAVLTTPNRSIPWVKGNFVEAFKGGLEPRERQQLTLQPPYGDWRDPQLKDLPDAELKVTVLNYEDANGAKVMAIDRDSLDLKRKVLASLS